MRSRDRGLRNCGPGYWKLKCGQRVNELKKKFICGSNTRRGGSERMTDRGNALWKRRKKSTVSWRNLKRSGQRLKSSFSRPHWELKSERTKVIVFEDSDSKTSAYQPRVLVSSRVLVPVVLCRPSTIARDDPPRHTPTILICSTTRVCKTSPCRPYPPCRITITPEWHHQVDLVLLE